MMTKDDNRHEYEKVGEFVSIYFRSGHWYANFQHEGKQRRRSLKCKSKKEARRRALLIEREILAGKYKRPLPSVTIKVVVEKYLQHLRSENLAKKTISKCSYCFTLLEEITTRLRINNISQLDVAVVDQYRAERAAGSETRRPSKPKTVHNDTVIIRQLVNFALKRGLIVEDPLKALKIKVPKRTPQPCWTRDEVDMILAATEPPHRVPLIFLAETGARVGEAKWLSWKDVDFERRLIYIRAKEGWRPKSGDERFVPMSDQVHELLKSLKRDGQWVFTARVTKRHPEHGRQISERRLLQYLKRVLERLDLKGHLHTFRHSFISFAAYEGISERVLRKWIGHVDREILDWYFHLADAQSQEAMKRLSRSDQRKEKKN